MHPVAVALGGAAGTLLRLVLTQGAGHGDWDPRLGVVNVVGAFVLGFLVRVPLEPRTRAMVTSGGLGALTSFSALSVALVDGTTTYAVGLGLAISVGLGVAGAALGRWIGGLVVAGIED